MCFDLAAVEDIIKNERTQPQSRKSCSSSAICNILLHRLLPPGQQLIFCPTNPLYNTHTERERIVFVGEHEVFVPAWLIEKIFISNNPGELAHSKAQMIYRWVLVNPNIHQFPENLKSFQNCIPIFAMLICLVNLKMGQSERKSLGFAFSDWAEGTCVLWERKERNEKSKKSMYNGIFVLLPKSEHKGCENPLNVMKQNNWKKKKLLHWKYMNNFVACSPHPSPLLSRRRKCSLKRNVWVAISGAQDHPSVDMATVTLVTAGRQSSQKKKPTRVHCKFRKSLQVSSVVFVACKSFPCYFKGRGKICVPI